MVLRAIRRKARQLGTPVYLVGGPLRDVLLGRPSGDIDLAVEGDAARFGKALARELRGTFKSYRQFGTGTVQLGMRNDECGIPKSAFRNPHCGVQVDVARTRTETYASSAALPLVRASDITADLQRRDFTVNAMAWRLAPPGVDGLIDVFNGQDDLRRGVIRVLHEKSFEDDPTRIFRAVRFAVRFGFRIEPRTLNLMHRAIRDRRLELLSGKRVMAELELVMQEIDSGKILGVLNRMGVFAFLSGARLSTDCLKGIARLSDPALRLLYLTSYLGARNWGLAVRDWPLTREQRAVLTSLKAHFRIRQRLLRAERPSRVFSLLESQARDALQIEAALEPEAIADKIAAFLDCYSFVRPSLTGQDLRRMGIRPGPMYTTLLNRLRSARLDGEAKTKEDEEQLVRRIMKDRELRSEKSEGRE